MELRPYQKEAVSKILWSLNNELEGNDLVVLPTGAGKSVVIAHLSKEMTQPILILQPSKEILEQNLGKLSQYVPPELLAVYSASMGQKNVGFYTFATIQSIYKTPDAFKHFGLVIIDEAHMLNPKATGMYKNFLKAIGNPKVIGFTATPYRMDTMYKDYAGDNPRIVTTVKLVNRMKGFFWTRILYNIHIDELIKDGYLCPLKYLDRSVIQHEEIPLNVSQSDFNLDAYEKALSKKDNEIAFNLAWALQNAKSILVFCSSVRQAEHLSNVVNASGHAAAYVSAKTPAKERDFIINSFKQGLIKIVFNVGVLTTGFDHPQLDCIVLLRPTRSIMLYCQMLGRGVRVAEGKEFCMVLDLTSNVKNIGRFETIKVMKREKWELESEKGSWHGRELYQFAVQRNSPPQPAVQSTYGRVHQSPSQPVSLRDGLLGETW